MPGETAEKARAIVEANAKDYIYRTAPEKYHSFIVPSFPLGAYILLKLFRRGSFVRANPISRLQASNF